MISKYKKAIDKMRVDGYSIPYIVGCIYDLYQDYRIEEDVEGILYDYIDPNEQYNNCGDYSWNLVKENPLMDVD